MRKLLFICVAAISFGVSVQAQTATEILHKVQSVYAGCRTYSDEGSTKSETSGTRSRNSSFRTSFVRPDGFRFELWLNSSNRSSSAWFVWKNGDSVRSQGVSSYADFNLRFDTALLRLAPFSGGSSFIVAQLLQPNEFRVSDLFDLITDAKIAGEEKLDGRKAFRIEGLLLGQPIKLWIDKTEYLVLKTYRRILLGERYEDATVQYKPKVNAPIPPEDLTLPPMPVNQMIQGRMIGTPSGIAPINPAALPPRLRGFGSSLSHSPNDTARPTAEKGTGGDDVVRVETDLVVSTVLVVDQEGKIVRGLNREDFIVKEDDKLQEVASVSLGDNKDLPRSIVLVIDYSGSQLPYIRTSVESAKTLVDKLNPKDRMAVVTDDVRLLVDFTSDKELLKSQLESLKTSAQAGRIGASDQYDALLASLNELFSNEDVRPIVIFQTDGDQLESLKGNTSPNPYSLPRKYGIEDILTATEKKRATIYSVISGVKFAGLADEELLERARFDWKNRQRANFELMRSRNYPVPADNSAEPPEEYFAQYATQWLRRQTALMGLAKYTGTIPEFLERPSQADEIYTRVLTDIDRRYVIGYYPTNRSRDGLRRKVSIEVRNHPEYTVWGQKSYFARKEE